MKTMPKKTAFLLSLLLTLILSFGLSSITAAAAGRFNHSAALSYAQNHWNDGVGLCSEFVSNCLSAGGCSAWSRSASSLHEQLIDSGLGTEYEIPLENGKINGNNYPGKITAGDAVFYYCPGCTDGKPYIHVVLCNGFDSSGYMKAFSHNSANSGRNSYRYLSNCYACNTKLSTAYVYHFNSDRTPIGSLDYISAESGTLVLYGWALDEDAASQALDIHVYVGGPAGSSAPCYSLKADRERRDVQTTYNLGANHGFSEHLPVTERGQYTIYVYAINANDGENTLLGSKNLLIQTPFSISFNSESHIVDAEKEISVPFTFTGDGIYSLAYDFTDSSIASVTSWENIDWSNGTCSLKVRGNSVGTTNLKISLLDTNKNILLTKSVPITVTAPKKVFGICFSDKQFTADINNTLNIPFTFTGDGIYTMSYAFSNSNVAQVASWGSTDWSSGRSSLNVKALKSGSTQLTVKLLDRTMQTLFEQSVSITVNDASDITPSQQNNNPLSLAFTNKRYSLSVDDTVPVPFSFTGDGIYTMAYEITTPDVIEVISWKEVDWTNGTSTLEIKAVGEGYTRLKIKLLDNNMSTLYSKTVPITVGW